MKKLSLLCSTGLMAIMSGQVFSANLTVEIQNLTQGVYFTPLAVVAHIPDASLFEVGEAASTELRGHT